ncbi:D-alanine--D-alanine ligase [Pararhizobium sp. YC-54]|uniref:D-alanine--D-alanine ligase family protein n=1 Tax=Pararhizobium sp. YC-54 TaxID=2986920 RepID=UPI0021F7A4AD|nr:D-alanine--D-alanine ligase family protein [Pararhizobium sp. YC-54]MCV9996877.1 D-alanine--D-alanine ligase [Pararhizobium sp. YC-54]
MMSKLRVAVLFGGRSAEHDVSVLSARNVFKALDAEKYDVVAILIDRDGKWFLQDLVDGSLPDRLPAVDTQVCLLPGGRGRVFSVPEDGRARELPPIDILFPVLHGPHGEDGSVQGLAEVAMVPFAGCGILGSATAIDKDVAKRLLNEAGLPVARALTFHQGDAPAFDDVAAALGLPVFVKPARQGSSVGVSKARTADDFRAALAEGFRHDQKLLVEEFVEGREIECSILEHAGGTLVASLPGEIIPAGGHGFYSYDAKYIDPDGAILSIPAQLPDDTTQKLRSMAQSAFRALGCDGMARVDFFVRPDMSAVVNEVNTIPGFTDISMYAKALAASGIAYADIIDRLIEHGLARAERQN